MQNQLRKLFKNDGRQRGEARFLSILRQYNLIGVTEENNEEKVCQDIQSPPTAPTFNWRTEVNYENTSQNIQVPSTKQLI